MKKIFYLVRHGESLGNTGADNSPDPVLSPQGRMQAALCAEFIAREVSSKPIILSSPFKRCVQTALFISKKLDCEIILEELLHESITQNLFPEGIPTMPSLAKIAKENGLQGDYPDRIWLPEKYESWDDVLVRAVKMRNLISFSAKNKFSNFSDLIIVAHWASIDALIYSMCDLRISQFDNCSVSKIIYHNRSYSCEYSNNTSFLNTTTNKGSL